MSEVDLSIPLMEVRRRGRDEATKQYIIALLAKTGGNVSKAAELAKIDRPNLRRFIRQLLRGEAA